MSRLDLLIWALAALVVAVVLAAVVMVSCSQPAQAAQKRNAYWPYSVETTIRDR